MLKVKAGKITNLTDARYFAAQNVEWMGFVLDPASPEALTSEQFNEIAGWIEGPKRIAEMGFCEANDARHVIEQLDIHAIQIGQFGELPPGPGVHILREVVIEPSDNIAMIELKLDTARQSDDEHFLLDFHQNRIAWEDLGRKIPVTQENLHALARVFPVILSIAFPPSAVKIINEEISPLGVELLGSVEDKPGYKSYDEMDVVFERMHE